MIILHLSDIHFGREDAIANEDFEKRQQILNELIETTKRADFIRPQHIVVTGDIAWKGKKKEFNDALIWFQKLLSALNLCGSDITFCVGNHDVNWSYAVETDDSFFNSSKIEDIKKIDKLYEYSNISTFEPPIVNYEEFCKNLGVEPFVYPLDNNKFGFSYCVGYKDVTIGNSTIRLVAFNTSMLSYSPIIKQDKMWLGQPQLLELENKGILKPLNEKNRLYTVSLLHHAERFLHPNEICEYDGRIASFARLLDDVDLVLCGHTETGGKPVLRLQQDGGRVLTAGATYYSDDHPNSFSVICIDEDTRKMSYTPYIYTDRWQRFREAKRSAIVSFTNWTPPLFDVKANGKLVIKAGKSVKEIPIRRLFIDKTSKSNIFSFSNEIEVARNITVCGTVEIGGETNISYHTSEYRRSSIEAQLENENISSFMQEHINDKNSTSIFYLTENGDKLFSSSGIKECKADANQEIITFFKRLRKIEKYYDVGFICPREMNLNEPKVELLEDLMEKGFSTKIKFPSKASSVFTSIEDLKKLYKNLQNNETYLLCYDDSFFVELYGVKIELSQGRIIAGEYKVADMKDVFYKMNTFMHGDQRSIEFVQNDKLETYFSLNGSQKNSKDNTISHNLIGIKHLGFEIPYIGYYKK